MHTPFSQVNYPLSFNNGCKTDEMPESIYAIYIDKHEPLK